MVKRLDDRFVNLVPYLTAVALAIGITSATAWFDLPAGLYYALSGAAITLLVVGIPVFLILRSGPRPHDGSKMKVDEGAAIADFRVDRITSPDGHRTIILFSDGLEKHSGGGDPPVILSARRTAEHRALGDEKLRKDISLRVVRRRRAKREGHFVVHRYDSMPCMPVDVPAAR